MYIIYDKISYIKWYAPAHEDRPLKICGYCEHEFTQS